jgi:hypothetical protein
LEFRRTLVREEYEEFLEALDSGDLAHQLKEAADMVYVLYGWDQHVGNMLAEAFVEVHQSNMSKLWPCDECPDGFDAWLQGSTPETCSACDGTGKVVRMRDDGKVLKPPSYQPPNIERIIQDRKDRHDT